MQPIPDRWNEHTNAKTRAIAQTYFSEQFYQGIFGMGELKTGYKSRDAFLKKSPTTDDHFLSPRLIFRAMMEECPELIHDYTKFTALVEL